MQEPILEIKRVGFRRWTYRVVLPAQEVYGIGTGSRRYCVDQVVSFLRQYK